MPSLRPQSTVRPRGVARNRRPSQSWRWERVAGCGIIAPRRSNSAHFHRRPRSRVRLQAGFSQPCRVAVASDKNIENNPMQSKQAVAGKDALGQYLTRRANQRHSFIIAQSARRPRASSNNPPNHAARRTSRLRFVRGSHGTTVATLADPLNGQRPRHVTLPCSDLALPLQRERNRAQQATIAWQPKSRASGAPSRPQAGGAGRAKREP